MIKIKKYRLLNIKFLYFSFIVIIMLFSLIISTIGCITILAKFGENIKINVAGILAFTINVFLFFFLGRVLFLYITYSLHDLKTKVKLNLENKSFSIMKGSKHYEINSKNIQKIELNLSTSNYRSLYRYFEYSKFKTSGGEELLITTFILNHNIIENMFDNVKKIKITSDIVFLPKK